MKSLHVSDAFETVAPHLCVALALLMWVAPARAAVPLAARAMAGIGAGGGRLAGSPIGRDWILLSLDLEWRTRPGRAYVVSSDWGGEPRGGSKIGTIDGPYQLAPKNAEFGMLLFGVERWTGSGVTSYVHGGIGPGWVRSERGGHASTIGVAVTGSVGVRLVGRPGPLGPVISFRTSHVIADGARAHVLAVMLGLTAYSPDPRVPEGPRRDHGGTSNGQR